MALIAYDEGICWFNLIASVASSIDFKGLSRSKITTQIKQGFLRLNWALNNQPSKSVNIGDLIHLEKKGSLKILNIDKTKKERWRIKLLRQ